MVNFDFDLLTALAFGIQAKKTGYNDVVRLLQVPVSRKASLIDTS